MKKEVLISYIFIILITLDLWLWVPFESTVKVDWFMFVDSYMRPQWYVKFTTRDLLAAYSCLVISSLTLDIRLKRVARAIGIYFIFQNLVMWLFDDKLSMTPFLMMLFTYCFTAIAFGKKFMGLGKAFVQICRK